MIATLIRRILVDRDSAAHASERERVSHVTRRLGMGANAPIAAAAEDVEAAIARCLDLSGESVALPRRDPPLSHETVYELFPPQDLGLWWIDQMASGHHPIAERLTWFWHDHFAVSTDKVNNGYLLWLHHQTVRTHATGNFAELLRDVSRDGAMLRYLDGELNSVDVPNENFGREVLELHTMGPGRYSQSDVVAASRSASGWQINQPSWEEPGAFWYPNAEPWASVHDLQRWDGGFKQLLDRTGRHDLDDLIDIALDHPATAARIAAKLYRELVGVEPTSDVADQLGRAFARDYEIMPLVERIVDRREFVTAAGLRAHVRTPVERLATLLQSFDLDPNYEPEWAWWWLSNIGYQPFAPPNPAGFPRGDALLSPGMLVDVFQLLHALADPGPLTVAEATERLGVYDLSTVSEGLLRTHRSSPGLLLALAYGSPEFALT